MFVFCRDTVVRSLGPALLSPGPNFPPDALWTRFATTQVIRNLIATGVLDVCAEETADLSALDQEAGLALIGGTLDAARLANWDAAERRPRLKEALAAQRAKARAPPSPALRQPVVSRLSKPPASVCAGTLAPRSAPEKVAEGHNTNERLVARYPTPLLDSFRARFPRGGFSRGP
jgi:hypothetical protein